MKKVLVKLLKVHYWKAIKWQIEEWVMHSDCFPFIKLAFMCFEERTEGRAHYIEVVVI